MKPPREMVILAAGLGIALSGCVQAPARPSWRYLQRAPVRVAVVPSINRTEKAGAPIVVDKAWEEGLHKAGFVVISADSVVTYAASRNMPVAEVPKVSVVDLGRDLKADLILENEIVDWGTKYKVISGVAVVSCRSRLYEARTGAVVWQLDWIRRQQSGNSGGGVAGVLVDALVTSIMNSMFDTAASLAKQGVALSSLTQPYPGVAPEP